MQHPYHFDVIAAGVGETIHEKLCRTHIVNAYSAPSRTHIVGHTLHCHPRYKKLLQCPAVHLVKAVCPVQRPQSRIHAAIPVLFLVNPHPETPHNAFHHAAYQIVRHRILPVLESLLACRHPGSVRLRHHIIPLVAVSETLISLAPHPEIRRPFPSPSRSPRNLYTPIILNYPHLN